MPALPLRADERGPSAPPRSRWTPTCRPAALLKHALALALNEQLSARQRTRADKGGVGRRACWRPIRVRSACWMTRAASSV